MSHDRPAIGICASRLDATYGVWNEPAALLPFAYVDAIQRAGGLAIVIPPDPALIDDPDEMLDRVDALVKALRRIALSEGVPLYLFGHLGEGSLHPNFAVDPVSPTAARIRAAVCATFAWPSERLVSQTTVPVSLLVAIARGGKLATVTTRLLHSAAPRFARGAFSCLGSMRQTMRPTSPERASIL